jgi:hypothetical protein
MTLYGFQSELGNAEELLRGAPTCLGIVRVYFKPNRRKNPNWVCSQAVPETLIIMKDASLQDAE